MLDPSHEADLLYSSQQPDTIDWPRRLETRHWGILGESNRLCAAICPSVPRTCRAVSTPAPPLLVPLARPGAMYVGEDLWIGPRGPRASRSALLTVSPGGRHNGSDGRHAGATERRPVACV